jgi:hypothetical protein
MRLGDYFRGLKLTLASPLPPAEVECRVNAAAASPLRPFALGILGKAGAGRLALRYRPSIFAYNGMPQLTGTIDAHRRGALLRLSYRGRLPVRLAFPLAYAMVAAMAVALLASGEFAAGIGPGEIALLVTLMVLVPLLPLAIHRFAIRNAEEGLERMVAFLRDTVEAGEDRPRG